MLVKWWLLAIPHYFIMIPFWGFGNKKGGFPGLIPLLVLYAAVVLLFTGKYPESIFKLVLGLNRWTYRVQAYTGLMTDEYPPFRLWDD